MQLDRVQDPRDNLDKARRKELELFAREHGVREIDPRMPATLMRQILRRAGLTDIRVPKRTLGLPEPGSGASAPDYYVPGSASEVNATDDLMRQWQGEVGPALQPAHAGPEPANGGGEDISAFDAMGFIQLKRECRRRGLHVHRTDKKDDLRAKIRALY